MARRARRTTGLTLIEMTLVIGTMALLMGIAVPAVRSMMKSFQTEGGVRSMIDAALSSARAMAMSNQAYVGVRFQKLCTSDNPLDPLRDVLNAPQYMIFIMHEEPKRIGGLANGFRAVEGLDPIKLPDTMGVMDLTGVTSDATIDELTELSDATTFSIVFAPSGKLAVHEVRVRNRNGTYRPNNSPGSTQTSTDDVFNSVDNICRYQQGMFIQDDYSRRNGTDNVEFGLGKEDSRTSFVIYELPTLRAAYGARAPWTAYLSKLATEALHVSPYAGSLISSH
jgi:type II secretory pathway pseudopilin PulG